MTSTAHLPHTELPATGLPFEWLGCERPYTACWQMLQTRAAAVAAGEAGEIVFGCEHEPVYTTGKRGIDNRTTEILGAPLIATDRGGETTFHGPGQVMLYPVIDIRQRGISPRRYVELLEDACIDLLAEFGVKGRRICDLPGVWTDEGKIAAIGLRITRGIAYHGMALNVNTDLKWFSAINPCGTGKKAVRLADYCRRPPPPEEIAVRWSTHFWQNLAII